MLHLQAATCVNRNSSPASSRPPCRRRARRCQTYTTVASAGVRDAANAGKCEASRGDSQRQPAAVAVGRGLRQTGRRSRRYSRPLSRGRRGIEPARGPVSVAHAGPSSGWGPPRHFCQIAAEPDPSGIGQAALLLSERGHRRGGAGLATVTAPCPQQLPHCW